MTALRMAIAIDSPREPLADLAARRREMLRPRSHRERGPMSDWQWGQRKQWERNFYAIALARVSRCCGKPVIQDMIAHANKIETRVEIIRNAQ